MIFKEKLKKDAEFLTDMANKLKEKFGDKVKMSEEANKVISKWHDETVKLKEVLIEKKKELQEHEIKEAKEKVRHYFDK